MSAEVVNFIPEPEEPELAEVLAARSSEQGEPAEQLTSGATNDPVKDYLQQIGKVPLLNAGQEVELAKRIEAGLMAKHILGRVAIDSIATAEELEWLAEDGRQAKNHLLEANLRLVVSIAKHYAGQDMPMLDLIQEGNTGLIRAVEKFDYAKGYKFSTYATWWIRQAITRGIAEKAHTIRIPLHRVEIINKLVRTERTMAQDLGREPTLEELSAEMELKPAEVSDLREYDRRTISLERLIGDSDDAELGDHITVDTPLADPEAVTEHDDKRQALLDIIGLLTERQATALKMRYGFDDGRFKTFSEIGQALGTGAQNARLLHNKGKERLKAIASSRGLAIYLGE
jgi:RNA polymerase primary sigma factor